MVFVIGLCEGRFRAAPALSNPARMAEERRGFHVAVTRFADELFLCAPRVVDRRARRPSRFVTDILRARRRLAKRWVVV